MTERLTVKQAQELQCCRLCRGPARPNEHGPFKLDYGHEFAHQSCLDAEELDSRVAFIQDCLETTKTWTLADYREFYARDLEILLPLAKAYLQQNPKSAVVALKNPDQPVLGK